MKRTAVYALLAFLAVGPRFTLAQQVRVVRVGVVVEEYVNAPVVNWTSNARWRRDVFVRALNHQKVSKNVHVRVEAVSLTTLSARGITSEARDKQCDYVLSLWSPGQVDLPFRGPENLFESESRFAGYPAGVTGYTLRRASDDDWLGADVGGPSDVRDAIMKAAAP